ncbi:MAG: DNA/RNA non-specific endonuclease [Opitutales bacterium]|jgi:endonuclease G
MNIVRVILAAFAMLIVSSCVSTRPPVQQAPMPPSAETPRMESADPRAVIYTLGGFPVDTQNSVLLLNAGYAVGYSETLMDPLWAVYYCGPNADFENGPRPNKFSTDTRVSPAAQLKHTDYNRPAGVTPTYDRGHMAPNYAIATRYGREAQLETFLLTNICPQQSGLNQQTWRAMEAAIANLYAPQFDGVWVVIGPIFDAQPARYNGLAAMPEAFYCIVVDKAPDGHLRALAVVMDQSVSGKHPLRDFATTVRAVEGMTGLDFFAALPDDVEDPLETTPAEADWNLDLMLDANSAALRDE